MSARLNKHIVGPNAQVSSWPKLSWWSCIDSQKQGQRRTGWWVYSESAGIIHLGRDI
ncbi:hypothetical protein BN77_p2150028 [Rhizobium mesoamericanum STM3625]|uniref:Uncharacterized protein n=1 Tax=Rhizobium mesoamericanum STM3625 TaxID=1211777 RepID=K0Q6K0_9HYPH|nr:hypothetical protein BN77_p2150028 [Rhizobium mesoamericanum STM3625]